VSASELASNDPFLDSSPLELCVAMELAWAGAILWEALEELFAFSLEN
jgi:hypothetical protein